MTGMETEADAPVELDSRLARIMSATAKLRHADAFDGLDDGASDVPEGVRPGIWAATRTLQLADAERVLQDPSARAGEHERAARIVAERRAEQAVRAERSKIVRAQASDDPADLVSRMGELYAKHADPGKVTADLLQEGWDSRLITPKLLAELDRKASDPMSTPQEAGMAEVVRKHLLTLQESGLMRTKAQPGLGKVPAQAPIRYSISGGGLGRLGATLANVQNAVDPQEERGFAGEQVAASGRAVGGLTDAAATWLRIAADKMGDPIRSLDQIAMLASPVYAGFRMTNPMTTAVFQNETLSRAVGRAALGRQAAGVRGASDVLDAAGAAAAMGTRPSPSVATGNWRNEDGSIAWKTIAAQGTETGTQLAGQIASGVAATAITGNPAIGVAVGAALGSGADAGSVMRETYQQQLETGSDEESARATAATVGMVYAPIATMLEYVPLEEYLSKSPVGKEAKRQLIGAVVKKLAVGAGKEGGTEVAQEAWQDFSQWAIANDKEAFNDWQSRYGKVGTLGAVLGGGANVAVAGTRRVLDTEPTRGEPVEPSKPLPKLSDEQLAQAKMDRAERTKADLPGVVGNIAKANKMDAAEISIVPEAEMTAEQKRVANLGNELGVDVVYIDGGKPLETTGASSRRGLVVLDRRAGGRDAAERVLQHEVVHELRGRLEASGKGDQWYRVEDAVRGADGEAFAQRGSEYQEAADRAGVQISPALAVEEAVASSAEDAVVGFLHAAPNDADLLSFAERTPNAAERLTDAVQRVLRKFGVLRGPTISEKIKGYASAARIYRELRSSLSILRETAASIPLVDKPIGTREPIAVAEDSTVDQGIPLASKSPSGAPIDVMDTSVVDSGVPISKRGKPARPIPLVGEQPTDAVPLSEGATATIPFQQSPAFDTGAGIPLAEPSQRGDTIPLEGQQQTAQPDARTLETLRRVKPKPMTKRDIESALVERFRSGSDTSADAAAEEDLIGTGTGKMFTFLRKIPGELQDILKSNPEAMRYLRVTDDPKQAGGEDAMADMGSDQYTEYLLRRTGSQVNQAKAWARKNAPMDPEAAFYANLLDELPKGKTSAKMVDPQDLEVGDSFTVGGIPVRVEMRGTGEYAYRVLVDGERLPATPVDAMDGGVPVDGGTEAIEKGEYAVEGEQSGSSMPEDATLDPGDDIPFALRRRKANAESDVAGQQGLYGQGTTKTGEKQGGLFGAVADEPKPTLPISPLDQQEGESDADYRIRMKFREAEKNTPTMFALRKNLVVMHNLSEKNLRFADELGGVLAMPSMAVANADAPLTGFGEISLVAKKDLVDPRASRSNRVFDADVYSPRYPGATYKFKTHPPIWKSIEKWVTDTYGDLRSQSIKEEAYDIRSVHYGLGSHLDASGGFNDRGIDELYRDGALQAYYAGTILGKTIKNTESTDGRELLSETIKAHQPGFEAWVRKNFAQHIERKLFKGFTNAGNRRYADYTIDNVMREMRKQQREDGGESTFYGAGSIRAKVAKKYRSISEIQSDRGRLVPSSKEMKSVKAEMDNRLQQIAESGRSAFESVSDRDFGFSERFWSAVFDARQKGRKYVESAYKLDYDLLPWGDINQFLDDLRNLPTEYFEAKIDRVVSLSEFGGAVVPNDVAKDVLGILEKYGISDVERYTKNDNADRARAMNALADRQEIKFALRRGTASQTERFRELQKQAMAERPGQQTIGRPDLANPGRTDPERRVVNAADQLRTERGVGVQRDEEVFAAAKERLRVGYEAEKRTIMGKVDRGDLLDSTETAMAQVLVADAAKRVLTTGDERSLMDAMRMHQSYRQSGTDAARAFRLRADRVESPAERNARFIGQLMAEPTGRQKAKLDKATEKMRTATTKAQEDVAKQEIEKILAESAKVAQKIRNGLIGAGIDSARINDDTMADPEVAAQIGRIVSSSKASTLDKVSEYWINAILSGPLTHAANSIGNAAYGGWETVIQRGIQAGASDALRLMGVSGTADARTAPTLGEYRAMARSVVPAYARAARNMLAAWRREVPILEDEVSRAGGESGRGTTLERSEFGPKIAGKTGRVVRAFGTRPLLAMDEFFKGLWGTMDVHARAYRIASQVENRTGESLWNRVADLTNDMGSEAWQESLRYAEHVAFQSENALADAVVKGRNKANDLLRVPVGTWVLPFVRTPLNIAVAAAEKTPAASIQSAYHMIRGDYKGNPELISRDIANNMVGWGLAALLWSLVGGDDDEPWITGASSPNTGERQMQYRNAPPMSVRIGNTWVPYARIEPFATVLGSLVDTIKRAKSSGSIGEGLAGVAESLKNQVEDKTFLQGLSDVFSMLDAQGGAEQKAATWAKNFAVSWVPNVVRQPMRATDPMLRETRVRASDDAGVWESALDKALRGVVPIAKFAPPPKVDVWGREVSAKSLSSPITDIPYRMFVPSNLRVADDNKLDRMIVRYNASVSEDHRWFPTVPSNTIVRTVNGERKTFRMNDQEYNAFLRMSGQNAYRKLMGSRLRFDSPTANDIQAVKRVLEDSRAAARNEIMARRRKAETSK